MLVFDAFLIWKKISHSLRRSLVGKRRLHVRNYSWAMDELPKPAPRIIWMYWDRPVEDAPPFVRYAIESWRIKNPTWEVRLLDEQTLAEWASIPSPTGSRKIQGRSDAIRLALLKRYGGVWVDATCCCVRPLDEWLPPLMVSGFFAFPDSYPGRIIQSWFIAADRDNYLIGRWADLALRYYSREGKLGHYFWVMYLFEYVVMTDARARGIWNAVPRLSAKGPILLKRILTQQDLAEPVPGNVDLSAIPVLKISSGTTSKDPEFLAAIEEQRDIDLGVMISGLVGTAD